MGSFVVRRLPIHVADDILDTASFFYSFEGNKENKNGIDGTFVFFTMDVHVCIVLGVVDVADGESCDSSQHTDPFHDGR